MKYLQSYKLFESADEFLSNFGFSIQDLKDWLQDILDEYSDLEFHFSIKKQIRPDEKGFYIYLTDIASMKERNKGIVTKKNYPISKESLQFLKNRLAEYNCYLNTFHNSRNEHDDGEVFYSSNGQYMGMDVEYKEPITESVRNFSPGKIEKFIEYFGFSLEDVQDWMQDILDEYPELDLNISFDKHMFYIFLEDTESIAANRHGSITSKKYPIPTEPYNFLRERLKQNNCYIQLIYHYDTHIRIKVVKIDKPIKESKEDDLLTYFGITKEEIKEWFQDFLDEHLDIEIDIEVNLKPGDGIKCFYIFLNDVVARKKAITGNIDEEKYPISKTFLQFLKDRLSEYHLSIIPVSFDLHPKREVYYSNTKSYMGFRVVRDIDL